jgi:hypothetical protein
MELNRGMMVFLQSHENIDTKLLIPEFKKRFKLSESEANQAIARYCCLDKQPTLQRNGS